MLPSSVRVCFFFLLILITVTATTIPAQGVGIVGTTTSQQPTEAPLFTVDDLPPAGVTLQDSANNSSTAQHENPSSVDKDGDPDAVQQWLASRLQSQLENSSTNLSQGEYETARQLVGDEYNQTLDRYVDLAEQTSNDEDDEVAERMQNTTEQHRKYVSTVEKYRSTREAYLAAKEQGNETRARQLARELNQLATQINRTGTDLTQSYETLGNETGSNLTVIQQSIPKTTENISTQQNSVRQSEFIQTTITIDQQTTKISFQEPLKVTGRLNSANGTALENRTIVVKLGPQTVVTTTTASGSFTVTARPTRAPRGIQTVSVHYLPENKSVYLGTSSTIAVNVTAVTPKLTVTEFPAQGQFEQTVSIAGRVDIGNVTAAPDSVPVRITLGSTTLGTTRTNANGSFRLTMTLPASVPAGSQELRAAIPLDDRALTSTNTTATIEITETPTQLSVTAVQQSQDRVRLDGELITETGTPIANQTIALQLAGQTITRVETNESGAYSIVVNASNVTRSSTASIANVTAVFAKSGSLNQATATTTIQVGDAATLWSTLPVSPVVLGTGVLGIGVIGVLVFRGLTSSGQPSTAQDTIAEDTATPASPTAETRQTPTVGQTLLEQATNHLHDGAHDDAVRLAYQAVRHQIATQLDSPADAEAQSHWEFYRTYQEHQDADPVSSPRLESLTESFERAQFTSHSVSSEQATTAVEIAITIVPEPTAEN